MHFFFRFVFIPFIICSIIFFGLTACSKEENKNEIPVVSVNFIIAPNSTEYLELNAVGGWVTVTGGYRVLSYTENPHQNSWPLKGPARMIGRKLMHVWM